jgi:hypothetical protein
MEKITLCGDDCLACPRYHAKTEDELRNVAELWYRVGMRDRIVSNEEICCTGCSSHKQCAYHLFDCTKENSVEKCNQCSNFPCSKIESMLARCNEYKVKCKNICSKEEYQMFEKAFFNKEENLRKC